ncbi:CSMD1 [Symbiodinium sp. CCMP2456]|nr:CSMD1 [Symbiodinium sp. CCMP2456]
MRRLTALALLLCLEVARAQELAVVRPFASSQEIEDMDEAFALWNTVSPCGDKALAEFDLILVYSRKFGQNPDALAAVERVSTLFRERTQPWHRCFREVHIRAANLTADEDVYDSRGYAVRKDWVNGPNKVFRYILRSFLDSTLAPADYDAFFFMEFDSVPLRSLWLDQLYAEVVIYPRAAIRGSRYRGDSWDPFLDEISAELLQHLNGNAIYFKHPWLEFLADQLEEDEAEGNASTAFDVRMAALTLQASLEAADNATTSLAAAWKQHVAEGEQPYRDDSLLVGNYANTLLNRSFDAGELVRHAALNNLLRNINQSQLTLAVIAYDDWSESKLLESLKVAHHPFRNVVVLTDGNGDSTTEIDTPGGPSLLQEQDWAGGSEQVLCDAASAVTTEKFVFTDTYHFISGPVQLLVDDDGHPVLPYIPSSSSYCTRQRECSSALDQAETFFGVELLYHHDTYETVFVTDDVRAFCQTWDVAAATLGSYENCDYLLGPTADDYIAWLISTKRPFRYMPKNKERVGWRPWTSLWTPPPLDERDCGLYREGEYAARLASIDECSFFIQNASACDFSPNCTFRSLFESGKCMQTRQFALLPRPPSPFTWPSTTTRSATRYTSTDTATATATTTSSTSVSRTASFTTSTSTTTSSWTVPTSTATSTTILPTATCQVPDIAGAEACSSLQPGETCQVLCPVGYQGESSEYTCLENLTFAGEQPECIRTTTSIAEDGDRRCSTGLPMAPGADFSDCFGIAAGAACTARCTGSFSGSPVQYYCAADGVFRPTGAALECQERFCDTSRLPSGYDVASCAQTSVGEVCFVRCPDGYLPAESLHVCGADGLFLGFAPTCERADCSSDLARKAADISKNFSGCSGIVAGSDCIVPCAFGHQGNPETYTCLEDGTLAGPANPCQPKICAVPEALADPSFGTNCMGIRHGETCLAACSPGFSGLSEQLRCENGVLQGALPKCTGFPCSLEGVRLEPGMDASDCAGKGTFRECSVQCGRGFRGQGSPVMTCQPNGRFTQHSLVCTRRTCGDLSTVPGFSDASILNSCAGRGFGEVCSAFCRQGWELQGNATVLVCDDAPDDSAGFSVYFESDGRLVHAAEAGGPFCRARPCTANLPNLQGVQHDCAGKTTHETCTVEAAAGYRFESSEELTATLVCQANGSFVGSIPRILADSCPEVQFGPGVGSTCINIPVDEECWAYCESGWSGLPQKYHCRLSAALELRASEQEINCTAARRLDASEPGACVDEAMATALSLPELTHSCSEMLHGDVCVVHCSTGWEMVEPSPTIITCDNASLVGGPLPNCRPKQCDFGLPNALGVSSNCSGAVTGEHCLAVCEEGYYSDSDSGQEHFLCTATGTFAGAAPDCRRLSCADLELGADFQHNCHQKLFGESCVVTCAAGFHLSGWGASFVCAGDGSFQGLLPLCQATVCESFEDLNFISTCDSVVTNGNCNVSCGPGYEQNSSVLTCEAAGTLVGQLPLCKPEACAVDPSLQSASYSHDCLALPFGRSCSVICADGFEPDTEEGQQGEQWQCRINDTPASHPTLTGILPSCRPAACDAGYPLQSPATRDNCTAMLTGQICVQSCATGYVPSDAIVDTFRCNPDGVLASISGVALACRVATCKLMPLGAGIVTTCAGEIPINSSCNAFCSGGFRLEGPVQQWRCMGPSELPALDGSDQDVALRGHLPACVPDVCAYNIPWEIDFDHNCSSVPTGSFCLVACPGDGNSSLLRCTEDGSLQGAWPLCNEVTQSSSETTTRTQTTTTRVIVLVGRLTVQTNSPDDLGDPQVEAGLTRALAQVLEVSPEDLELLVQAVEGSADLAEVQFSSATAPTMVQLQELQRTTFAEVGRAFAAEFVNYTEADIAAVGPLVLSVQLRNETVEVSIAPPEASPDTLQFTATMTASAGVLLLCCACAGCFVRQRLRQAGEGSECPCSCASAQQESGSLPEVASDVQTSIGEAGSDTWDWEDEGVTRTLPPSREVTAGISSLVMSTSAGSGCPTRSPTMKDLREAANHGDSWLGVVLGEQTEDTTVNKLEALVHGVGFQEPLAERLADAGIYLQEDEDDEDGIQEFRLALEDVGVHFEEVHVEADADTAPRVKPGVVCSSRVNGQELDDFMDEDLFEV